MRILSYLVAALAIAACSPSPDGSDYRVEREVEPARAFLGYLAWTTPIDPGHVESELDADVIGASLKEIVSGPRCTQCHHQDADLAYAPPVAEGEVFAIAAEKFVSGRRWRGPNGWANAFLDAPAHVADAQMRALVERWNDDGQRALEPLLWSAPISFRNLGYEPADALAGVSLDDIVNGRVVVRDDGATCNACHYEGGTIAYRPPEDVSPYAEIDGRSWAGQDGWAARFLTYSVVDDEHIVVKPEPLRDALLTWRRAGERR